MGLPAARLTDNVVCPAVTGVVPHVGGPISGPGAPTVLIGSLPGARISDMNVCAGGPGVVAKGSGTVIVSKNKHHIGPPLGRARDLPRQRSRRRTQRGLPHKIPPTCWRWSE